MPIIIDTLPQQIEPITVTTLEEVIRILPEQLDYPLNVWIGGKLARYGQTDGNLMFLIEQEENETREQRLYFEAISKPFKATCTANWRDQRITAVRLYNKGRLIIDKETMAYTELPTRTETIPVIQVEDVVKKLPKEIDWKETIYLVGGIVKNGWSGNDVDFMVDSTDTQVFRKLKYFFEMVLWCKVDVGNAPMPEREPIYKVKVYEDGKCLL